MERKMVEKLMTYRYLPENDEKDWRSSPLIKNHPVEAVYALLCGNCGQAIWGEMELDGENFKLHFFNNCNDYHHSPFRYGHQEELTHCPRCGAQLNFQDDDLVLDGGKVLALNQKHTLRGSRGLEWVLSTFDGLYRSSK